MSVKAYNTTKLSGTRSRVSGTLLIEGMGDLLNDAQYPMRYNPMDEEKERDKDEVVN